ncbi:G3BP-like protein [Trifolium pratense]|uniref:G3BP-like protein n=1 Tax=Trifolium pratense TaxID=57577 RepID=A0A2K3KB14_TRIPR|nr:G3BP-like protein [Trifolium pratense]
MSEVVPGRTAWRFTVRVARIWEVSTYLKNNQVNSVEMVLVDSKKTIALFVPAEVGRGAGLYHVLLYRCLQVGSYFVGQYYQVLRQQPDLVHQFYSDSSSMIRVDGDYSETASDVLVIYIILA